MLIGNRSLQSFRGWNVSLSFRIYAILVFFEQIGKRFDDFSPNPLYEIGFERVPGRSFRIDGNNQVDSLIAGMKKTAVRFEVVLDL